MNKGEGFYVTASEIMLEHTERLTVYGIAIQTETGKTEVPDISADRRVVEQLCEKLQQAQLSPLHLKDVVEDFLNAQDGKLFVNNG